MRYAEWFKKQSADTAKELAGSFPVTLPAVYQWATEGVPVSRMEGVEEFTQRAVSLHDMVLESADFRRERMAKAAAKPSRRRQLAKA